MMMPSIFRENLFDDFMNDFTFPAFPNVDKELYGKHAKNLMKTDVKDTKEGYKVDIHPKYENGILSFVVPKEEEKPVEEKSHYITIE